MARSLNLSQTYIALLAGGPDFSQYNHMSIDWDKNPAALARSSVG